MSKSFNLIDEKWIPLENSTFISLREAFNVAKLPNIGGNAITKISIYKLLQAIAMSACQINEDRYDNMEIEDFSYLCDLYLDLWHDHFDIYHPTQPFLQFPELRAYESIPFEKLSTFSVASDSVANRTILNHFQLPQAEYTDQEKALILLAQQSCAFSTKALDHTIVLSKTLEKKKTACTGSALGYKGYLHSFILGPTLLETIVLNIFTEEEIKDMAQFENGFGVAPWVEMPTNEKCPVAENLKNSLMGRLLPMNRFCLLKDDEIVVIEGIIHLTHKEGLVDPSVTLITEKKEYKALWADTTRLGWRYADAILSFLDDSATTRLNQQVKLGLDHAKIKGIDQVRLISLGIQLTNNAGEHFVSKTDEYVYSELQLNAKKINSLFYTRLKEEWDELSKVQQKLYFSKRDFFIERGYATKDASELATQSNTAFWSETAKQSQNLILGITDLSDEAKQIRINTRKNIGNICLNLYQKLLHTDSSRYLSIWVKNKPYLKPYTEGLNNEQ